MIENSKSKSFSFGLVFMVAMALQGHVAAQGISLTSPANVTMQTATGLTGVLDFSSNVPTQANIRVQGPRESWLVDSSELLTDHSFPLLGFEADTEYDLWLTLTDASGATQSFDDPLSFETAPLPDDFPTINIKASNPARMEPGYTLIPAQARGDGPSNSYAFAADAEGRVRWYREGASGIIRREADGDLLLGQNVMLEGDFLGNIHRRWHVQSIRQPPADSIELQTRRVHHEMQPMPNGHFVSLINETRTVENFPTDLENPDARATVEVIETPVIEFAPDGTVVNKYSMLDMLDPTRIGYGSIQRPDGSNRWAWGNAVIYDEDDNAFIASLRYQDALVKFSRETGDLIWILGNHENWGEEFQEFLLEPQGENFEWQYHQHAPFLMPNGNVLVHDNGDYRGTPPNPGLPHEENYTRAVEYAIDEENMQITQVWEYGRDAEEVIFSTAFGDADWLSGTDNVLITFGWPRYIDGELQEVRKGRVVEVDREGNVLFDLELDYPNDDGAQAAVYRSDRIPALYPPEYEVTSLLQGDIDGNGAVEFADFLTFSANFGMEGGYLDGDIDGNGTIEFEDFLILSFNFGQTAEGASVPEPTSAMLLLLGFAGLVARRSRQPVR